MLESLFVAAVLGAGGPVPVPPPVVPEPRPIEEARPRVYLLQTASAQLVATVPVAPAPREAPVVTASYHLRNIAAADAAVAFGRVLGSDRVVRARPVENQIVVTGTPATHARVVALVGELDRTVPQVHVSTLVAQVPLAFLDDCGLTKAGGVFSLGKRERDLFNVAFRHYPQSEVWARPELLLRDNQTSYFQVGQNDPEAAQPQVVANPTPVGVAAAGPVVANPTPLGVAAAGTMLGLSARITPRIMPDGKVMLRVEPQLRSVAAPVVAPAGGRAFPINIQTVQTTVLVADGETVVLVGPTTTGSDGKPAAMLFVLTPNVVRNER